MFSEVGIRTIGCVMFIRFVWSKFLCFNCLNYGYRVRECRGKGDCKDCDKKYLLLLYFILLFRVIEKIRYIGINGENFFKRKF